MQLEPSCPYALGRPGSCPSLVLSSLFPHPPTLRYATLLYSTLFYPTEYSTLSLSVSLSVSVGVGLSLTSLPSTVPQVHKPLNPNPRPHVAAQMSHHHPPDPHVEKPVDSSQINPFQTTLGALYHHAAPTFLFTTFLRYSTTLPCYSTLLYSTTLLYSPHLTSLLKIVSFIRLFYASRVRRFHGPELINNSILCRILSLAHGHYLPSP